MFCNCINGVSYFVLLRRLKKDGLQYEDEVKAMFESLKEVCLMCLEFTSKFTIIVYRKCKESLAALAALNFKPS